MNRNMGFDYTASEAYNYGTSDEYNIDGVYHIGYKDVLSLKEFCELIEKYKEKGEKENVKN